MILGGDLNVQSSKPSLREGIVSSRGSRDVDATSKCAEQAVLDHYGNYDGFPQESAALGASNTRHLVSSTGHFTEIRYHAPLVTGDEHCAGWFHRFIKDGLQINISVQRTNLAPRNLDRNMA